MKELIKKIRQWQTKKSTKHLTKHLNEGYPCDEIVYFVETLNSGNSLTIVEQIPESYKQL